MEKTNVNEDIVYIHDDQGLKYKIDCRLIRDVDMTHNGPQANGN